jgi:uncharacterized protein (TIGR00369 family)
VERVSRAPKISGEAFLELAADSVPLVAALGCRIERFEAGALNIRLPYAELLRRPGGTVCGPALMALADVALWGLVMSVLGRVELAVTTDLSFHFLRRPAPKDVLADARLLKLGRRLAVGEVTMRSDGDPRPICQATGTYALPPGLAHNVASAPAPGRPGVDRTDGSA